MKKRRLIYLLFVISIECFGQNGSSVNQFWHQQSLSGAIGIKGHYRNQQQILGSGFKENIHGTLISGGLLLNSKSSMIRPGMIDLDLEIEYNPEKMNEQFLTIPDRSEVRTLKRLNFRTTFFQEKKLTFNAFVNLNQNFINRENFTNSRTNRKFFGGGLFYKNKVLPSSITYQEGTWDQNEIETGRTYSYWQRNIKARVSRSFFSADKNFLSYSYDDYIRKESFDTIPRRNKVNYIELNSNIPLDQAKDYNLNAIVSNFNQKGWNNLNRFQVFTNLNMKLPHNFRLLVNYNFFDSQYLFYRLDQYRAKLDLSHQLFKSLTTNIFVEYNSNKHTIYQEYDNRVGFSINYTKKIPKGRLNISYSFIYRDFKRNSEPVPLKVEDEEHVLSDEKITLLDKPFVEIETVVVKDITGTIIYVKNLDYLLSEQNNYIEIKRIPGGMIPNSATVLVDYTTLLPGSYKFTLNNQAFTVSVLLFKRFIELYYRRAKQNYNNVEQSEPVALNFFLQNVYGVKFDIGLARFGVEYDDYKSSIIPYRLIRSFINLQWRYKNKFLFSAMGNIRYYITIGFRVDELYADISGRMAYSFTPRIKLNVEVAYRQQNGYQIDLDYLTARTELTIIVRKIYITVGAEVYRRNYLNRETINFNGAYVSIVRKFKSF